MNRWWPPLRDIAITGSGLAVIASQVIIQVWLGRSPSDVLLAVGLALTTPAATAHVRTLFGQPGSSESSPPDGPPPSSPGPQGVTGERPA